MTVMRRSALGLLLAAALALPAFGQQYPAGPTNQSSLALIAPTPAVSDNGDRVANTAWVNSFFSTGLPLANGKIIIGSVGGIGTPQTMSGDCTLIASGVITCTQAAGNFQVIGNLTVGGSIIDGSGILFTNIAAPATPAAGTTRGYVDSTTKTFSAKNDAGTVSNTVVPSTAGANTFATAVSSAGVVTYSAIAANSVTRAMEAQGIARSVVGVTGNAGANVADIQGTADQALVVNSAGTALAFGKVNLTAGAGATGTLPVANGGTGDTGTAWTAFTPTPVCGTTTITVNSARSKTMGKTTWVELDVTFGTIAGACTTTMTFTLPNTSNSSGGLAGREMVALGSTVGCGFLGATATASCSLGNLGNFLVNYRLALSGVYENQ